VTVLKLTPITGKPLSSLFHLKILTTAISFTRNGVHNCPSELIPLDVMADLIGINEDLIA
jgi:hypothetical protein